MKDGLIYLFLGTFLLYTGAEGLVHAAKSLSLRFKIPSYLVGLTVVAVGTSLPEAVTTAIAQWKGASSDLAIGNIIGSNLSNFLLIGGCALLLSPSSKLLRPNKALFKLDLPALLLSTLAFPILFAEPLASSRWTGCFILLIFSCLIYLQIKSSKKDEAEEETPEQLNLFKLSAVLTASLAGLASGGYFLVEGASQIAYHFGISERVIGLTIVAMGTSAPELATTAVATFRGHPGLVIGNIVGSNLFNLLFVTSIASLVGPLEVSPCLIYYDYLFLLVITALTALWLYLRRPLSKSVGAVSLITYLLYLCFLIST